MKNKIQEKIFSKITHIPQTLGTNKLNYLLIKSTLIISINLFLLNKPTCRIIVLNIFRSLQNQENKFKPIRRKIVHYLAVIR